MLSLRYIRENKVEIVEAISNRNIEFDINQIIDLDKNRRHLLQEVEILRSDKNQSNQLISQYKKDNKDTFDLIKSMKDISSQIKKIDFELNIIEDKLKDLLLYVPNIPDQDVPIGSNEKNNKEVSTWGCQPEFNYEVKSHVELCQLHKLIDFKRAATISGTGFTLYTNKGARLERALINFMLDIQTQENNYVEIGPPLLVNKNSALTTGQLPKFSNDMYYVEIDKFHCIPTAEVPLTNIHSNEIIKESMLPIAYTAYTPCFRREAGSYGKDTKGLLRLHQFNKVELVKFVKPSNSNLELEQILSDAVSILKKLNLHYRIVQLCTGDLSFSAAKCYDIEVWSPSENKYLEVSSCSNFRSFQAIRGNIKFRKQNGKIDFLHTLNGSGLATPRLMVAILESYQEMNGDIIIPDALVPYFGSDKIS